MRHGLAVASILGAVLTASGCGGKSTSSPPASGCTDVATPKPRDPGKLEPPAGRLDLARRWTLTFQTSCGTFVVLLRPRTSPHATASLVALARRGYFDDTVFDRIVPGFVIQGGDPTQTRAGGPGYTTVDTPASSTRYTRGIVAMAKTLTEPRGAAGSEFFVMTAAAPTLSPDYAVVGAVISGLATVDRIGRLGDPADPQGTPTRVVVIDHVAAR